MYSATENNPRDRLKKPVYWLVFLVFLCSLIPWHSVPEWWQKTSERAVKEAFFTATEVDEAWREYDEVLAKYKEAGNGYSPKNFFQDRTILIPLRYKFEKAISFEGESDFPARNILSLSPMCEGLVKNLYARAEENFPRYSPKLSLEEQIKNSTLWHIAESEAPIIPGCEPLNISGWALLRFCKWVAISYLKFLPFAGLLIIFHLWRKRQSVWQEVILRPGFLFTKILQGPVGVAVYAGIGPVAEWQFAKLSAAFMRQRGKWHLSPAEEDALWEEALRQAEVTPEMVMQRSKMALAMGYLIVVLSAPFIALSNANLQQRSAGQAGAQSISSCQGQNKQEKLSQWFMVDVTLPEVMRLHKYLEPVARVENEILPAIVAEKGWFLPPILAPPLRRR